MPANDGSLTSAQPDYRKLADEVRALIASGAFHTREAIEDLQQLAASYDALASLRCKLTAPLRVALDAVRIDVMPASLASD